MGLSLAKLNRVIDYPAADLTITVEAGVTMAELAQPWPSTGNDCRSNAAVGRSGDGGRGDGGQRPGTAMLRTRDDPRLSLGFRAVDGRGVAFAAGGRVVKNAAGYNICRLMAGSLGTLGVVAQVTLLVRPVPETSALAACDLRDLAAAERLLAALDDSQTLPVAVELIAGPPRQEGPAAGPEGGEIRLIVGFEGSRAEVDWMTARICEQWRQAGVSLLSTVGGEDAESWWRWLTDFPADLQISALPSRTVALVGRMRSLLPECRVQAHAAGGVIRVQRPLGQDGAAALFGATYCVRRSPNSAASSSSFPPRPAPASAARTFGESPATASPSCGR